MMQKIETTNQKHHAQVKFIACPECFGRGSDSWDFRPCQCCKGLGSIPDEVITGLPF